VYADGKIYLMAIDGTVSVVKAGRKFELLASNNVEERIAASLAISDGTIYLRSYEALYAIRSDQ
jgi:outer membrane protein assembly factor BamB